MGRELDFPLFVDRSGDVSVRRQLVDRLRAAIADGTLRAGSRMPSSRAVADAIGISRTTVTSCYLVLEGEGLIRSRHGTGTFVAHRPAAVAAGTLPHDEADADMSSGSRRTGGVDVVDLRPGDPDPDLVARTAWRAAWRQVTPSSAPPPAAGDPDLRDRLAGYLGSARGLRCHGDEIVLCAGTGEALTVLSLALGWAGRTVAVEDPGYAPVRAALTTLGAQPVGVDASSPQATMAALRALPRPPAAVHLTPSHQYPLGHTLPAGTRAELVSWSRGTGTVIVEDDYDGEFRFGVSPVESLAGLDPDSNTVYLGSFSKVLDPGLRAAYLRVPPHLSDRVRAVRAALGSTVSTPVQQVLTGMLASGELARHIARVRRVYEDRRRALITELEGCPGIAGLSGAATGLHLVARLIPGTNAAAVVSAARSAGVLVADLDEYRTVARPHDPALVLGYGRPAPTEIRRGVAVLRALVADAG